MERELTPEQAEHQQMLTQWYWTARMFAMIDEGLIPMWRNDEQSNA